MKVYAKKLASEKRSKGTQTSEIHTEEIIHICKMCAYWWNTHANRSEVRMLENIKVKDNQNVFNRTWNNTLRTFFLIDCEDIVEFFSH